MSFAIKSSIGVPQLGIGDWLSPLSSFGQPESFRSGSPAATGLGTATRGCFVKFIPAKYVNPAWFCVFMLSACLAFTGTSMAQNQYYVNASAGSDSNDGSAR